MYDYVFAEDSTQDEVYQTTTSPLIKDVLKGYSAAVFAYGATGSGNNKLRKLQIEYLTIMFGKLIEFDFVARFFFFLKVKHIQCLGQIHERLLVHRHLHQPPPNFHQKQPYQFKHNRRTVV